MGMIRRKIELSIEFEINEEVNQDITDMDIQDTIQNALELVSWLDHVIHASVPMVVESVKISTNRPWKKEENVK
jgi:hypothetical protein